jgi:hypothetical protein
VTHTREAVQPGSDRMTKHEVDCTEKRRTRYTEATVAALALLLTERWEVQKIHNKGHKPLDNTSVKEGTYLMSAVLL